MARYIDDIIYFCEPFDRWHAWHDLTQLSQYNQGRIITPERVMASRWQWSIGKVRRYLAELCQYGALQQVKSGRNNILRIAQEYQAEEDYDSKGDRLARWKEQVIRATEGEEQLAVEQYITYWSSYSNITKLFKFETTPEYDIISTWEKWLAKRKELQTTKIINNNGRKKQYAAHSSTESNGDKPFTIGDFTNKPGEPAEPGAEPTETIG